MISSNDLNLLKTQLDGELHTDTLFKSMYAVDASVYRELPLAVALPKHANDIKVLIAFAQQFKTSLIPRAGGTSLAGQCVGAGIVVDVSKYMNAILEINPQEKWIRVQPGVIRDELNVFLKPYGLFFGPNTSTSNRCNIGGMVGNNSCGTTSIVYGSTRDHVLELTTILSDGQEVVFGALDDARLKQKCEGDSLESKLYQQLLNVMHDEELKSEIKKQFPKPSVTRRNTGYALDTMINQKPFNFCHLLCGSEGTLAFTTEIKLNLVDLPPEHDVVLAAHFSSIQESLIATVEAMKYRPTACELMDKTVLDCTKNNIEQQRNRFFVDGDPQAVLMIEFRGATLDNAKQLAEDLKAHLITEKLGYAFPIISGEKTKNVWDLRKAGLGLLANIPGDKKTVTCIEDTAVAVEDLPAYIDEFSELMKKFNQEAVYYAHAGAGELHLRPMLNLKDEKDLKDFRAISKASAELVKKYNGSLSGEHGDGRVRAEFIPLVLGEQINRLFENIKQCWDPHGIFNPGKIVNAKPMDQDLRYIEATKPTDLETQFNFNATGGILKTVEKCNGSGDCRKLNFAGGTMCPSYRATLDEKDTTRGRANVLREFLTLNTKANPFDHAEIKTAMDLCISCKGCKSECPSNVDMATLKAEFQYQYNKSNSVSLRDKLIANNAKWNAWAAKLPGLSNAFISSNLFKSALGIARARSLPKLSRTTLSNWLRSYDQQPSRRQVYLFIDEYINFYDVEIGQKTVKLLNALGYEVLFVDHEESGRAFISKGFLDEAKAIATNHVAQFSDLISEEVPLIGIEPSAILSFRDEYPNLVDSESRDKAIALSAHVMLIDEFLATEIENGLLTSAHFHDESKTMVLHGHCHQKALSTTQATLKILGLPKNYDVTEIPSGCCGMAGSFGYEKEHYDLSMKIGSQVLFPTINKQTKATIIVAPGTSCRHQIKDGTKRIALHPVEVLYDALQT